MTVSPAVAEQAEVNSSSNCKQVLEHRTDVSLIRTPNTSSHIIITSCSVLIIVDFIDFIIIDNDDKTQKFRYDRSDNVFYIVYTVTGAIY